MRDEAGAAAHDPATVDEHEVAGLATGFALGELDEDELRRLYDLLRLPGDRGAEVARLAWQVLGTTVDLRASLGSRLQDTVRHRIEHEAQPERERSFLGGVLARIGLRRPRLEPVPLPPAPARRRAAVALALGLGLLAGAAATAALVHGREAAAATAEAVAGVVTVEGAFVAAGDALPRGRPVVVGAGGRLDLRWRGDGRQRARAVLVGPARLVPLADGLSVVSGRARVTAEAPFLIGAPDRQAALVGDTTCTVEVRGDRSLIGVARGLVRLPRPDGEPPGELAAGQAVAPAGAPFAWIRTLELTGDGPERRLASDPEAAAWRIAFRVAFPDRDAALELRDRDGARLRISPQQAVVETADGRGSREALDGPPLRERLVVLERAPDGEGRLAIDGLERPPALPFGGPPTIWRFAGGATIAEGTHHTGPEPVDRAGDGG